MKTGLLSLCCALMLFASCGKRIPKSDAVAIVPKPVSEQLSDSTFDLTKRTRIRLLADDSTLLRSTDFFNGVVSKALARVFMSPKADRRKKMRSMYGWTIHFPPRVIRS